MSYTGYNQNSIYWEGQDRRNQRQDGSSSNSACQTNPYLQNGYQNQENHQQSTSQAISHNVSAYGSQGYSGAGTVGNQQSQSMRPTYTTGHPDTTALGNLAYASRMVQNPSPPEPVRQTTTAFRQQQQDNAGYGNSNLYGNSSVGTAGYGLMRTDSPNALTAKTQPTTSSQYQAPSTTGRPTYQSHPYIANNGRNSPAQPPSTTSHVSRSADRYPASQQMAPQRPISEQALHRPSFTKSSAATHSSPNPASKPSMSQGNIGGHLSRYEPGIQQAHSSNHGRNSSAGSTVSRSANTTPVSRAQQPPSNPQAGNAEKSRLEKEAQQRAAGWNIPKPGTGSSASGNAQTNGQVYQESPRDNPVTVDPNQVFNNYEYLQKRRAEAEAARKKEDDANIDKEIAKQRKGQTGVEKAVAASSQPSDVLQAAQAMMGSNADPESAKKDEMELEMKQMIEKMRDYKAKDPSLFSQIWEQVKKGQPVQRAPSQPAGQTPAGASPVVDNSQLTSPTSAELPAESELTAATFPAGFDRGRYPAQRRRRGNKTYTPDKSDIRKSHHKKKDSPVLVPQGYEATSTSATAAQTLTHEGEAAGQRLKEAMQGFHNTSESPVSVPTARGPTPKSSVPKPSVANPPSQPAQNRQASGSVPPMSARQSQDSKLPEPPRNSGTTFWPEDKKRALASAAVTALKNTPQNAGKTITADEIHAIFNQNPSYTQLCELIERKGFVMDRGQFARVLLAAVPNLNPTTNVHPGARHPQPPPPGQAPPAPMTSQPPHRLPHHGLPDRQAPFPYGPTPAPPPPLPGFYPTPGSYYTPLNPASGPVAVSPAILGFDRVNRKPTKQEKAVKRSFGEIVDLTQRFSDEEEEFDRYRPKPRVETSAKKQSSSENANTDIRKMALENFQNGTFKPSDDSARSLHRFRHKGNEREHLLSEKVVEPMDPRRDALRRSDYNAKTIARDILISSGRHPSMESLNWHLAGLRGRFASVNYDSDLHTFRWDLVDPGGDPPKLRKAINTSHRKESANNSAVPSPKDQRVSVVVESPSKRGFVPDFATRPLTEDSSPRKRGRPKKNISSGGAASFVPPGSVPPGSPVPQQSPDPNITEIQTTSFSPINHPQPFTPVDKFNSTSSMFPGGSASSLFSNANDATPSTNSDTSTPSSSRVPGRKGRPPGAKNKHTRVDKGIPKKSTPLKFEAPTRPATHTTPRKPSGLRNAISPIDGIAVVIPSRSPSVSQTGSAQPEQRFKNVDIKYEEPQQPSSSTLSYKIYKCYWNGCPSELHNLDTLRKHVRKHRQQMGNDSGPPFVCKWEDCFSSQGALAGDDSSGGQRERLTFASENAWDKHVETIHIRQYTDPAGNRRTTGHSSDIETPAPKTKNPSHTRKRAVGIGSKVGNTNASRFMDGAVDGGGGGSSSDTESESEGGTPPPIGS